jgi:lysophospholipase L1-like esterase
MRKKGERRGFRTGAFAVSALVLTGIIIVARCTNVVTPKKTLALSVTADSTVLITDTLRIRVASTGEGAGGTVRYACRVDNAETIDTSADTIIRKVFAVEDTGKRCVIIKAIGSGGMVSAPDSLHVRVRWRRPTVTLGVTTPIAVNDSELCVAAGLDSCGAITTFWWKIDSFAFMTQGDSVRWLFNDKADAYHTVLLAVVDNNGFVSDTDSVTVHVMLRRPTVSLAPHDTSILAATNFTLRATGADSNGTVVRYSWMLDGRAVIFTADSLTINFDPGSAGMHYVTVTAINADSLASLPDTSLITVRRGGPVLLPLHDTTLSNLDTMTISCQATDSNGTIVKYLWNLNNGSAWTDSTALATHILDYAGSSPVRVIVGARDNHGLIGADTFTVTFNRGPDSVVVISPAPIDTVLVSQQTPVCSLSFAYGAMGVNLSAITYSLTWGANGGATSLVYQGPNVSAQVPGVVPGSYVWKVLAADSYGHIVSKSGSVVVLRQYLLGFVGHSIIAGYMGDGSPGVTGGFRCGVLDSLRAHLGPYERVKAVGPVTPALMGAARMIDDSCLGLPGATGPTVYQALSTIATQMTADVWVLMTGVNDGYNPTGLTAAIEIIDLMHQRNPNSRIYALDALPRPSTDCTATYFINSFNQGLADTIQVRQAAGTHVSMVEVDSLLCPHGIFTPAMLPDSLHPNQAGYDLLAKAIYATMKSSNPPVLP